MIVFVKSMQETLSNEVKGLLSKNVFSPLYSRLHKKEMRTVGLPHNFCLPNVIQLPMSQCLHAKKEYSM